MANELLEQKHADELSVERYTFKKIRELIITGVAAVGGALIGTWAGKSKTEASPMVAAEMAESIPLLKRMPNFVKSMSKPQAITAGIGAGIGALVGALVIGYEHWRKEESQKLAVNEMNQDMANTIAIQPTDKELVSENKRLRGMLEELENKRAHSQSHAAQHSQKSHMDHAVRESHTHERNA